MFFLIFMFGSPNLTTFTEPPSFTQTPDFFGPPGVRNGLFNDLPLQAADTRFFAAISISFGLGIDYF